MVAVEISQEYGYVLLSSLIVSIECLAIGMVAGRMRKSCNLKYPDNGYGRYADKLNEKDWISFASGQRAHYNFIEGLVPMICATLVAGIFLPYIATGFAVLYAIGRVIYTIGYIYGGPEGRIVGALILDVGLFLNIGIALYQLILFLL